MRTESDIARDIVEHPERDDFRVEFADAVKSRDPQWAKFINRCLDRKSANWDINQFAQPKDDLESRLDAPFRGLGQISVRFHRGFPTTAYVPVDTFLEHGDELLSIAPILEVVLSLPELDDRGYRPHWNTYLPSLVKCPALARVRELTLGTGWFDFASMKYLIASPYIENLLRLRPGDWMFDSPAVREQQEDDMWRPLLESPVFRRMIDWGILSVTRRHLGDRLSKVPYDAYDGTTRYEVSYEPMSAESRALEQEYGYIPCLHAANWDATVLDVLRGVKPDYPAGARPTEEMYAVPPPADRGW